MYRTFRAASLIIVTIILANPLLSGCSSPCTYPDQRTVKIRVFNAMPDENHITVFLNGKLFIKDFSYDPPATFGYFSTYDDGTPLDVGSAIPIVISSDAAGKNIILKTTVNIDFHLQTLVVMGKGSLPTTRRVLRLADDMQATKAGVNFMRFVHAVPDLPALDIYWKTKPDGSPNATIQYGVENPYLDLTDADFLKVTEAGKPNNVIFNINTKPTASLTGLVLTTIVRGESKPYGLERIVSTFILSDDISGIGNFVFGFETFGVRLVNASRALNLNLLVLGFQDKLPRIDYPGQNAVEHIGPDSVTTYLPLMPSFDSLARFWFAADLNFPNVDTLLSFNAPFVLKKDHRYSIIAVENKKLNESGRSIDSMIVLDSMTNQAGMGRVRVIDLSPDHPTISFNMGAGVTTMTKKQVAFFDVTPGSKTITLSDGTDTKDVTFNVPIGTPVTVYLMPAVTSNSFPINTSND
ncbi:MAG: DUF4397 domain-containing protein [Bacteroidota bacterium]|nr:DUF4397 domain-containing protein [Bacteroidota bacterium]MDP4229912.1 DUF4397 domain-containing protein [Bacteroidota bacterium]MDP4235582.1 DUF4397 domain-containing protein [Bacteroidota bacterium]